jgi:micrococcal nuclease
LPTLTATPINTLVVASTSTSTPIPSPVPTFNPNFQTGLVVGVVAGDIIDVMIDGVEYRVKYILVDAPKIDDPERGTEPFGPEALEINRLLVEGQTVTLEKDVSNTDEFGRLLRYVYVGDLMVNEQLVADGWAEAVLYEPDSLHWAQFVMLEQAVEDQGIGCHPTGIFDDQSYER